MHSTSKLIIPKQEQKEHNHDPHHKTQLHFLSISLQLQTCTYKLLTTAVISTTVTWPFWARWLDQDFETTIGQMLSWLLLRPSYPQFGLSALFPEPSYGGYLGAPAFEPPSAACAAAAGSASASNNGSNSSTSTWLCAIQ
jgi:hypothetical protein